MTYTKATIVLLAPLLLSFGRTPERVDAMLRKCRNVTQKEPVIFVDGLVASNAAVNELGADGLSTVEVVCLSPVDSTVLAPGSQIAGIPAVIAWSRQGPASHLQPVLVALLRAQQAHFARTGKYSGDLAQLSLPAVPAVVKLSLDASPIGWSARSWVDRRFTPRCAVFAGDVASPPSYSKDTVACSDR